MTGWEKGPRGLRRGRGARERILGASRQLFREQGINSTGMDQLCAVAHVVPWGAPVDRDHNYD